MRRLLYMILLVTLASAPVFAAASASEEVRALLRQKIDKVVALLHDASLTREERNRSIIVTVSPIFSFQTMAKLSLGREHWPKLTPEQQEDFSALFETRLKQSYVDKLDLYSDEEVRYGDVIKAGNQLHALTTLTGKDDSIEVLYKFFQGHRGWQVYDVEIGGVSVIQTYRSQFDGIISESGIDGLFDKLKSGATLGSPATARTGS
jgi:phospholipid transport system substrate-binding protein